MHENLDNDVCCIPDLNPKAEPTVMDANNLNELHIVDEDVQCGHIYLHEPSKMLKFFCIFCEKTYDNINLYCDHLSEHVYGAAEHVYGAAEKIIESEETQQNDLVEGTIVSEPLESGWIKQNTEEVEEEKIHSEFKIETVRNEEIKENEAYEYDDLVETEEEDEELVENCPNSSSEEFNGYDEAEIDEDEEESRQFLFDQITVDCEEVGETAVESETKNDVEPFHQGEVTDFESLIENAKILKKKKERTPEPEEQIIKMETAEPLVKRIKIITLKNKIDELYSMFKPADENESTQNGDDEDEGSSSDKTKVQQQTTQIIGETVITSLPVEVSISKYYGGDEFKCLACEKTFRNQASLATHSRTHYLESRNLIKVAHKCADCNKLFNKLKDLQKHIHEVHYPEGFKCRLCHKVLRSMALLEVHMKKMHVQGRVSCRFCGLPNFKSIQDYEEHIATHALDENYKCYICGRRYTQEWNLKNHIKQHALRAPKCCVVCGKVTIRLTQHMKIHSPRPARLHQCPICNNIFSFSSALSRHIKVMHKLPRTGRTKVVRKDGSGGIKTGKRRRRQKLKINDNIIQSDTEEAGGDQKKVIVEMIENVVNRRSLLDSNNTEYMDCTVARYETIAAVNSITAPSQK